MYALINKMYAKFKMYAVKRKSMQCRKKVCCDEKIYALINEMYDDIN